MTCAPAVQEDVVVKREAYEQEHRGAPFFYRQEHLGAPSHGPACMDIGITDGMDTAHVLHDACDVSVASARRAPQYDYKNMQAIASILVVLAPQQSGPKQ